jgi:hypothetical protein
MALITLPCSSDGVEVTGKVKVVNRVSATGPAAEQAAIDEALAQGRLAAQNAMRGCRCKGSACRLNFGPEKIRIRSSGSQNNPAYPIIGAAIAVWSIYPRCEKIPKPLPLPAPAQPVAPEPPDIGPVSTPQIPVTTDTNPYPFSKEIPGGTVWIEINHSNTRLDGAIIFDFKPRASELCDCASFGWIQHVQRGTGNEWHYDNGGWQLHPNGTGIGATSDPTQPVQPTQTTGRRNPWYGAPTDPNAPDDFEQHPTPQTKIGDHPSEQITSFVTQLVCVTTGQVLFTWYWGPVLDKSQPLEQVPAGPAKQ